MRDMLCMIRKKHLIWIFLFLGGRLSAQGTVRIMQYNLLQYGNPSAYTGCNETNNGLKAKDRCLRTILNFTQPDILTVNEFSPNQALASHFCDNNLNINGSNWRADSVINTTNSDIVNHIFYNADKLSLQRHTAIATSLRDIDAYELYFKTAGLPLGDTIKIVCVVAHLKAGKNSENAAQRFKMAQQAMDFINESFPGANVMIMGDFNLYSSNEAAYRLLTQDYPNPDIRFIDPIETDGVGVWHNNFDFAAVHTQSTNADNSIACMAGGGLDDRFDFILVSDELVFGYYNVRYVEGSYKAIGNDGRHFNLSINDGSNGIVPQHVADALHENSDHLPVVLDLAVGAKIGVEESPSINNLQAFVSPNPCSGSASLFFRNNTSGMIGFEIHTIQGQSVLNERMFFETGVQQYEIPINRLQAGFYLIRITGSQQQGQAVKLIVR